mgnify:CR=1 FL=1
MFEYDEWFAEVNPYTTVASYITKQIANPSNDIDSSVHFHLHVAY